MLFSVTIGLPFFSVTAVAVTSLGSMKCVSCSNRTHFENLALDFGFETDAHEFLFDFVALRYADDHVVDQRTVETVQRTVAGLVGRTRYEHGGNFVPGVDVLVRADLYLDVRVHFLTQRPEWPFHAYHIVGRNLYGNAGGQVYR